METLSDKSYLNLKLSNVFTSFFKIVIREYQNIDVNSKFNNIHHFVKVLFLKLITPARSSSSQQPMNDRPGSGAGKYLLHPYQRYEWS